MQLHYIFIFGLELIVWDCCHLLSGLAVRFFNKKILDKI